MLALAFLLTMSHSPPDNEPQITVLLLSNRNLSTVEIHSAKIVCDERVLTEQHLMLELDNGRLRAGKTLCKQVTTTAPFSLHLGAEHRSYFGTLSARALNDEIELVGTLRVEPYVEAVVSAELDSAGAAALEAQAVVSRTFAHAAMLHRRHAAAALCDLTHCQLYRGADTVSTAAKNAVGATAAQVLSLGGVSLRPTYFHAACGGHTSAASDVFSETWSGPGVADLLDGKPACGSAEHFQWRFETARADIAAVFATPVRGAAVTALRRDTGGRILEASAFQKRMSGAALLSALGQGFGWQSVRSVRFTTRETDSTTRFEGTGVGHGVGLCQAGAQARAKHGASARAILKHYFPEHVIVKVP
jgi:stage II sporulation protein D